jgi:transposase-like protein DUF772
MLAMTADDTFADGHPLRRIREMASNGLVPMAPLFIAMASSWPLPPAPDRGLLCILLMALYGIRNETVFCQELSRNPQFCWFVGMSLKDASQLDPVLVAQMRSRLLRNGAATEFFERVIAAAGAAGLLTDARFSPDTQQIAMWTGRDLSLAGRHE